VYPFSLRNYAKVIDSAVKSTLILFFHVYYILWIPNYKHYLQEECQDLYQRMTNGLLKKPTIVSLLCVSDLVYAIKILDLSIVFPMSKNLIF
jgi:hypothetical protein